MEPVTTQGKEVRDKKPTLQLAETVIYVERIYRCHSPISLNGSLADLNRSTGADTSPFKLSGLQGLSSEWNSLCWLTAVMLI